ncbi:MAG: T9SS type A sorting domain-containing protein [Ignavibacteriales bacterium]|nr:MAG: T9SS type A sorting domain-containing protein [Ignavibacteriales bacterium]
MKSHLKIFFILLIIPTQLFSQQIWEPSGGPAGGTVENIIRSGAGLIFATLAEQGIILSDDSGLSWVAKNNGLPTRDVLSVHSHNNGSLFSGMVIDGIYRSEDNGNSWINVKRIDDLPFSDNVRCFTSDNLGNVYAGAQFSGVFRSTNNGNSWTKVNYGLSTRNIEVMASTPNGYIFAGTMNGLYRSTNQGGTWSKLNLGIYSADITDLHVTVKGVLYAATYGQGIVRSYDNGGTWEKINFGLSSITGDPYPAIYSIASDDKNQVYASAYLDGVFYLEKSEQRWYKSNLNLPDGTVYSLLALPDNQLIAGTSRAGIFISNTNTIEWKESNQGIYATDVYSMSSGINGYIFASVFGRGIYSSKDEGATWELENTGLTTPYIFSLVTNNHGTLFAGTYDGQIGGISYGHGVFRSTNDGETWVASNNGLNSSWVNKLAVNKVNNDLYAATINSNAVYRSSDQGMNWIPVISNETANAFVFNNNGDVFAAIYNSGIYRSSNNGMDWTAINSGLQSGPALKQLKQSDINRKFRRFSREESGLEYTRSSEQQLDNITLNITSLCIDGHGTIYAGGYGELYRSVDNGDSWDLIEEELGDGWITSLVFDERNNFYAAVDGNVLQSQDYGFTWNEYQAGLTNFTESLFISPENGLFAATRGGSVFKSVSSSTSFIIPFNALLEGSIVEFNWEVETELLSKPIQIELSKDGKTWNKFATIESGIDKYEAEISNEILAGSYFRLSSEVNGQNISISKSVQLKENSTVSEFQLEQNFPNPFNPSTKIEFTVPVVKNENTVAVILKIYDALGREVKTLVNDKKSAGVYTVEFIATEFPSGVYFYNLNAGDVSITKKMVLAK